MFTDSDSEVLVQRAELGGVHLALFGSEGRVRVRSSERGTTYIDARPRQRSRRSRDRSSSRFPDSGSRSEQACKEEPSQ